MHRITIDMIVPGLFATGLTSQTFLPSVPAGSTPFLDAVTAFGQIHRCDASTTLGSVCTHLHIDPQIVASSQAALCWLAEFKNPLPPWVAVAQPIHLGVGRTGLTVNESRNHGDNNGSHLLEVLQPVASEHGFTLHRGSQFQTLFLTADQPLDVSFSDPSDVTGTQLRNAGVSGGAAVLIDRLRTDIEMALHEHGLTDQSTSPSQPLPNSLWFWGGSRALPRLTPYTGPIRSMIAQDALYCGLASHLGLPFNTANLSRHSLLVDSTGVEHVRGRNIEKWYEWIVEKDQHWTGLYENSGPHVRARLTDPLGARCSSRRIHWPWHKRTTFFDHVNAIARI